MCGLFGFSRYGEPIKNLSVVTNSLAEQSAIRGTDATGIAFNDDKLKIIKEGKSAYEMDFKHSDDILALIGHTRHSTQGSEKKNQNNHPFPGKVNGLHFALAHNGVLTNDDILRVSLKLPKTKIETDSYVAAQLLMSRKNLDFESLRYMAEKVHGSFSFSVLDEKDNLFLVKGDSPIHLLHFPKSQIYVYASTESILFKALVDTSLFAELKKGCYEEIEMFPGEILKISSGGMLETSHFQFNHYDVKGWWEYNLWGKDDMTAEYIEELKAMASIQGIPPEDVDELLADGFGFDEIEEYLYGI
jgi:glutamine phosphoribosylpyrophosphate amidotransferase